MIDVHSHIVYGVDDGAKTIDDSLAMLRLAHECGTTDIVATPHASPEYSFNEKLIAERIAELQAAVPDGPRIHPGCDFHLSFENIQDALEHPRKYTIAHRRYLLVEFPDLAIFPNTSEIFDRLMRVGIVPVITHPERNRLLQQKLDDLKKWTEMGVLIQVTANSLLGAWGNTAKQFSDTLMKHKIVHVIASDAHDIKHRPPTLVEARKYIEQNWGEERAQLLTEINTRAILEGYEIESPDAAGSGRGKPWWKIWA